MEEIMTSKMRTLLMVAAIAALVSVSVVAQDGFIARATVPFDFMVGDQRVPAGQYEFARGPVWLKIRSRKGDMTLFVLYQAGGDNQTGYRNALIFNTYGNQHFLHQIWLGNGAIGVRLGRSRAEKEQLAHTPPRTAVVASMAR
jgi:hypothetical protein